MTSFSYVAVLRSEKVTPEQLGAATNAELSGSCHLAPLTVTPVSFLALWRPPELYMLHCLSLYGGEVPPPNPTLDTAAPFPKARRGVNDLCGAYCTEPADSSKLF